MRAKYICLLISFNLTASGYALAQKTELHLVFRPTVGLDFNSTPATILMGS